MENKENLTTITSEELNRLRQIELKVQKKKEGSYSCNAKMQSKKERTDERILSKGNNAKINS